MELYYARGSSSLWPHIVLHEAGLPFATVEVDEHAEVIEGGGDYRKVSPLGYVPALVPDDGTIVQYIADQAPTKELAPPNGTVGLLRFPQADLRDSDSFFENKVQSDVKRKFLCMVLERASSTMTDAPFFRV